MLNCVGSGWQSLSVSARQAHSAAQTMRHIAFVNHQQCIGCDTTVSAPIRNGASITIRLASICYRRMYFPKCMPRIITLRPLNVWVIGFSIDVCTYGAHRPRWPIPTESEINTEYRHILATLNNVDNFIAFCSSPSIQSEMRVCRTKQEKKKWNKINEEENIKRVRETKKKKRAHCVRMHWTLWIDLEHFMCAHITFGKWHIVNAVVAIA